MRKLILAAVLGMMAPSFSQAAEHCNLTGTWLSPADGLGIAWMATTESSSVAGLSGTGTVEVAVWPDYPYTRVTLRGAWERTGPDTFVFTQIGWVPDETGFPMYIAKNVGTETITNQCSTITIVSTMEILDLNWNQLVPPTAVDPPMVANRVVVQK